jgi:hypothetical protein
MKRKAWLRNLITAVCLFTAATGFLASRGGLFRDPPARTVFGDTGDGLFNLWILEHVRINMFRGWAALSDGRILHPATDTFWFSDNLLTLSPPYLLARMLGASLLTAGYLTSLFWLFVQVFAAWWLFSEVRKSVSGRVPNPGTRWDVLSPLLALTVTFVPARMWGLQHFQNHALVFWLFCAGCALHHLRTRTTASCLGIGTAWACLLASSPYYAIMGLFPLVGWGLCLLSDPETDWRRLVLRQLPFWLPIGLLVIPVALEYLGAGTPGYLREELVRHAWRPVDLLPPIRGGNPHGYPGIWLVICGGSVLGWALWHFRSTLINVFKRWEVLGVAAGWGISFLKIKEFYAVTVWLRMAVQLGAVGLSVFWLRRRGSAASRALFFLIILLLGVGGTALGPGTFFRSQEVDPSIWGMLNAVVPGYGGMRNLIRFAPLLTVCGGALVLGLTTLMPRPALRLAVGVVLGLGLVETQWFSVPRTGVDPASIKLEPGPARFFQEQKGVLLVVPSEPFHRNTVPMLRWQRFRNLRLVNGYSGRLTEKFSAVMRAEERYGPGSVPHLEAAHAAEADWVLFRKDGMTASGRTTVMGRYPVIYEDNTCFVIQLSQPPSPF